MLLLVRKRLYKGNAFVVAFEYRCTKKVFAAISGRQNCRTHLFSVVVARENA